MHGDRAVWALVAIAACLPRALRLRPPPPATPLRLAGRGRQRLLAGVALLDRAERSTKPATATGLAEGGDLHPAGRSAS